MAGNIDAIIDSLCSKSLTLEAACKQILEASKTDPSGTRFWNLSIEAAIKQKKIPHAMGRSLLDALEGFATDRTVWIDSGALTTAVNDARSRINSTERQLLDLLSRHDVPSPAIRTASPLTGPVEWYDGNDTSDAAPETPATGSVLKGRYQLGNHIGAGGIGQVFEAIDLAYPNNMRPVTVKIVAVNLRHQPDALSTLEAAVRRTQHLSHPNVVAIHDIGRHGDNVFIVMEPLRGRWLSALIREVRGHGMPYATAWPVISGIANGLAHAHSHGIVHADLSPHAVFLCDDGTAKIMCFGLINALPNSNESLDILDTQTLRAYTEAYAADPWAQLSRPHPSDDLYPLGVIAYEMLTGAHPFLRHSMVVARQKGMKFAPIAGLNSRARKLLERCLSFERDERPSDASRFLKRMQPGLVERMLAG